MHIQTNIHTHVLFNITYNTCIKQLCKDTYQVLKCDKLINLNVKILQYRIKQLFASWLPVPHITNSGEIQIMFSKQCTR